ncbi:carbohydrate-binding protein [Dactylosporangium sp. NPDC050688]|uniref:carbohydrate-binding protein n=1 Tax=Dactylosporangium sp. NPDC050688 TaxID=3157217 RepID=UPI0034064AFD
MQGVHRLGRTDRTLLWGTAALIAFTLGAVTAARTHGGGTVTGAGDDRLCYNSAGVGAACLPPGPTGFDGVTAATTPAQPSPTAPEPAPGSPAKAPATSGPATTPPPVKPSVQPSVQPSASAKVVTTPAWAVGVAYAVGARISYQGGVYVCRQAHTSQADWPPDLTPALWGRVS